VPALFALQSRGFCAGSDWFQIATTTWDEDLSSFGDKESDWKSLGADARSTFETFISKWLKLTHDKNENILGYAIKPDDSDCKWRTLNLANSDY
jgi:hypothetical protein